MMVDDQRAGYKLTMPSEACVLVWKAEAQQGLMEAERSWDVGRSVETHIIRLDAQI
jgi:hypothetical protein